MDNLYKVISLVSDMVIFIAGALTGTAILMEFISIIQAYAGIIQ